MENIKKLTDAEIMRDRAKEYGPVKSQMAVIGTIQMELSKYCLERNEGKPAPKALAHLAALNLAVTKMVRSVSNREHEDNYCDGRNYLSIAEMCTDFNQNKEASR